MRLLSLTAPPRLLTLVPWGHSCACLLGILHQTLTGYYTGFLPQPLIYEAGTITRVMSLSTIRTLSCKDVSNPLESGMGARSQQQIKEPWTALWRGSCDPGLDQWTRTTLTPTPACAHGSEQEEEGKDREQGSGDPSGSSLYFPGTWWKRRESLMGAEKLGKDHRLRRERREEDTPLGSNTRQHKTSAETAGGLWPLADVGAGQDPGKVALRNSQSSNYREGWGSPPWLHTAGRVRISALTQGSKCN